MSIIISATAIDKCCRLTRSFPPTLILDVFRDTIASQDLSPFPNLKTFNDLLTTSNKLGTKMPSAASEEISTYFTQAQEQFLLFIKSIIDKSLKNTVINKVALDAFISKVNIILQKDSQLKIEGYKVIQKMIPNKAKKKIFLNLDVPDYVQDYFSEAIDCQHYSLYRSSILFSTFSLEASLRYKYSKMESDGKAYSLTFNNLIDWGIKKGLIEENDFNKANITFIREYRNDLVHFNMDKPDAESKISRDNAEKMSPIIIELVKFFMDSIFYS